MINGKSSYTSKDFYLSACLLATGKKLLHISDTGNGFFVFCFDCNEEQANDVLNQHWNGQLLLPTKAIIESIYQIKNRMKFESRRQYAAI